MLAEADAGWPSHVTSDVATLAFAYGCRDRRAHERQPLPLLRLSQHCRGDQGGRGQEAADEGAFTYQRVSDVREATSGRCGGPDAVRFIAGGTNLLDLMKLEIETPSHVVDISRLPLKEIEATPDGGLRVGALVTNSDLAADPIVRQRYPPPVAGAPCRCVGPAS